MFFLSKLFLFLPVSAVFSAQLGASLGHNELQPTGATAHSLASDPAEADMALSDNYYSFTVPRHIEGPSEHLLGIVVEDFPARACRGMLQHLQASGRLTSPVPFISLLPSGKADQERVRVQMENLLDLQKVDLQPANRDLRQLLVKELRHALTKGKLLIKELTPFRKAEAVARSQLTTKFVEKLERMRTKYEQELMQQLRAGRMAKARTITRLFVSNITDQVEQWMVAPTFASSQLQVLLCLVFQLEDREIALDRSALERAVSSYMLAPTADHLQAMREVARVFTNGQILLTDPEMHLLMEFLQLAWNIYYEHSVQIIQSLNIEKNGISGAKWLRKKLLASRQRLLQPSTRKILDRYGFLSAAYIDRWIREAKLSRVTLLLPNCRLAHVAGEGIVTFNSIGSFAVSIEYNDLLDGSDSDGHHLVSLVMNMFNSNDFDVLKRHAAAITKPQEKAEVVQLTPTTANSIRQRLTTSASDLGSENTTSDGQTTAACHRTLKGVFTGEKLGLRALLNIELIHLLKRMRNGPLTIEDQSWMESLRTWEDAVQKEKAAMLEELQLQMETAASDPNLKIHSLFFSPRLADKIFSSPNLANWGNVAAIAEMSAVQQMRVLTWAVKLDPEILRAVQLNTLSSPDEKSTHDFSSQRKMVFRSGKQSVVTKDIVDRVAVMLGLTCRLHHRFSDNVSSLLPGPLRGRIGEALCGGLQRERETIEDLFNSIGFVSAFRLMLSSQAIGAPMVLLDKKGRIASVSSGKDARAPIVVIEDPESGGLFRGAAGSDLSLLRQSKKAAIPWAELPGLRLLTAFPTTFPSPVVPRAPLRQHLMFWKKRPQRQVKDLLTESVALEIEKSLFEIVPHLAQGGASCTPTSVTFVRCIAEQLLSCKDSDLNCKKRISTVETLNSEAWERAFLELKMQVEEENHIFKKQPWNKLRRVVHDVFLANRSYLSAEEREVVLGGMIISDDNRGFQNLKGIHLLRMRSILSNIPHSDPGVKCLDSLLSGQESSISAQCRDKIQNTFVEFLSSPKTNLEVDSMLLRASRRASSQLRDIQIVDRSKADDIAEELRRLHHMDLSSLYDFLISPLIDHSSSPKEKQALGFCLYKLGQNLLSSDKMFAQSRGLVLRSGSPQLVRRCLIDVWHIEGHEARQLSVEAPSNLHSARAGIATGPPDEMFRRSAVADLFLHLMMHNRLSALMEALALFRKALDTKDKEEIEKAGAAAVVFRMRSLEFEDFRRLLLTSDKMIPFSLALVSRVLKKDVYLLYFIRNSGAASFIRIGHGSRSRFSFLLKRWSRGNILCTPRCAKLPASVDMEAKETRKVARELSSELRQQTEAFKNVARALFVMTSMTAAELTDSFRSVQSTEMQTKEIFPGDIEVCSRHMRGGASIPLPFCSYEAVSYRYAHEALRLTLAQKSVTPHAWFRFFTANHTSAVKNCLEKAKQLSKKGTLEDFTKLTEWRRFLPAALASAAKALQAGFADFRKLLALIEGRFETGKFVSRIRGLTHKIVKWIVQTKKGKAPPQHKQVPLEEHPEIEIRDVISLEELNELPSGVVIRSWRDFAYSLDGVDKVGMSYDHSTRLLVAIGTGFKCSQRLLEDPKIFLEEVRGNKEAEEVLEKLAADFFLSAGAPQDGFRALREEVSKVIGSFCHKQGKECSVNLRSRSGNGTDTCEAPRIFCTQALACAEKSNRNKAPILDAECVLRLVDMILSSRPTEIPHEAVLKALAPVLAQFPYTVVLWNQVTGTVMRFKQKQQLPTENVPIQIVIAPTKSDSGVQFIQRQSQSLPTARTNEEGLTSSSTSASSAEEYSAEDEDFLTANYDNDAPAVSPEPEKTEMLLVSPGFDLYERLLEARRFADNEQSPLIMPHGAAFFNLEHALLELQDRVVKMSIKRATPQSSLAGLQQIVDELSSREGIHNSSILRESKILAALGPNEENQNIFHQQKRMIESVLAEAGISEPVLDLHLLESLTAFQLFVACEGIPSQCDSFRREFLNHAKDVLKKALEEGMEKVRLGQHQPGHLQGVVKVRQAIEKLEAVSEKIPPCLTNGCQGDSEAIRQSLQPMRRLLGLPRFLSLKTDLLDKPANTMKSRVPLGSFRLVSHMTLPHLRMQQWMDALANLRQSEGLNCLDPEVARSISSVLVTCFGIAKRRVKEALLVLQKAVQQISPNAANGIAQAAAAELRQQGRVVKAVLDRCCGEENFREHGATYLTHELIKGLRERGYTISEGENLEALMDNGQGFSTWIQQAVAVQVEKVDSVQKIMTSVCSEGSFYSQGAAECTRRLLRAIKAKKMELDKLTSIKPVKLSEKTLTYQEWLQCSSSLNIASKRRERRAFNAKIAERQHEALVWTVIAEILYRTPDTPWRNVHKVLTSQSTTAEALSKIGLDAAKTLYAAVRSLHRAVSFVDEKDFKRFGAYAVTNMLLGYLSDKGVYVAGNSAVTLRSIMQAKSFSEWRQDVLILKVSTKLIKPLGSELLISEINKKRIGPLLFRLISRSRLLPVVVVGLVKRTVSWVAPYIMKRAIQAMQSDSGKVESTRIGSTLLTLGVLANGYLNLDSIALTKVLPLIVGIMESHNTRSAVETILTNAQIPRILSRTILNFSAIIEDAVLDAVERYLDPEILNDLILKAVGVNLDLQNMKAGKSLKSISDYVHNVMRHHAPIVFGDLRRAVIEPIFHASLAYAQDLTNTFISVGARELPARILSPPSTVHAGMEKYYLQSSRVMDSEGQQYLYEAFLSAFNDRTLFALNPPNVPRGLPGFSSIQKVMFSTFLAPFEGVLDISDLYLWDGDWVLETKNYSMRFYGPLQSATYGFVGLLKLSVLIRGKKISLEFFVESMTEEVSEARKLLKGVLWRKPLRFAYSVSPDGNGGSMKIFTQERLIATFATRQRPPITQSFSQVDFVHQANVVLAKYSKESSETIQGAIDRLDPVFKGVSEVTQLEKCAAAFTETSLFSLLLDFEYYSQPNWFTTNFHINFATTNDSSSRTRIMVMPKGSRVHRLFSFDHFICQDLIAKIPAELHVPCEEPKSRLRRTFSRLWSKVTSFVWGKEGNCLRKARYYRENGEEVLDLSWVSNAKLDGIKLPVKSLNQPNASAAEEVPKLAVLRRHGLRLLERVLNSEAGDMSSLVFPALRWLVSSYVATQAVLSGAFRRERATFQEASIVQNQIQKRANKEVYSLKTNFFKVARIPTNPGWAIRINSLLGQAKYKELFSALGSKRKEFVDALASVYTTWVTSLHAVPSARSHKLSEDQLDAMCPDKSKLEACEKNYGLWGSFFFPDGDSALGTRIARKPMDSPYLFAYWKHGENPSSAKWVIADFQDMERYKHAMRQTYNLQVVGTLQASISILLDKYRQALLNEESGMNVRSSTKFQILKYLHIHMREVLEEAKLSRVQVTTAHLSSGLRAAGYEVLVRVSFPSGHSLDEEKEMFNYLEGLADLFYGDLQLPTKSMHLSTLYDLQFGLNSKNVHLPFVYKMIGSNPLSMHAGFHLFPKNQAIRKACRDRFCPHPAVMWNHVYLSMMVLLQLMESVDVVAELLAADSFSHITGHELNEIPLTFEESFIAFKVGLGYICELRDKSFDSTFFSTPLSSESLYSFITSFSESDKDFSILLLHLPPQRNATFLRVNNRATLQETMWNGIVALWSVQEVFGRLQVDTLLSMTPLPSFAPPFRFTGRGQGFWMPQCVLDPLWEKLGELFGPVFAGLARLPEVWRVVDSTLHDLTPSVRRKGYISHSDSRILALWWKVMDIAIRSQPRMETEAESFFRSPLKIQAFGRIVQDAATISAFLSQLKMADTKKVLTREPQRFAFESWNTLVSTFLTEKPSGETVKGTLHRIFHVACRMIPAVSENQSIAALGKALDGVELFRAIVDAITLRLMQLRQNVPPAMTHYPICKAVKQASCEGIDSEDPVLSKACKELDVVRRVILSTIGFSDDFCLAMKRAEKPLIEKSECGEKGRNFHLLREFFMSYMSQQVESSAIKSQWKDVLRQQDARKQKPSLFPLAQNVLASTIHEVSIRVAEQQTVGASAYLNAAEDVYLTMCSFVDYIKASLELKHLNVCSHMTTPPEPLIQTLSEVVEAHVMRIQIGRLTMSMRPVSALIPKNALASDSVSKHPGGALAVGLLRFARDQMTHERISDAEEVTESAYGKALGSFSNIFKLLMDRLYKLKPQLAEWQKKTLNSITLLVSYVVRLILSSAKQMFSANKDVLGIQKVEYETQMKMRRRLHGQKEEGALQTQQPWGNGQDAQMQGQLSDGEQRGETDLREPAPEDHSSSRISSTSEHVALVHEPTVPVPEDHSSSRFSSASEHVALVQESIVPVPEDHSSSRIPSASVHVARVQEPIVPVPEDHSSSRISSASEHMALVQEPIVPVPEDHSSSRISSASVHLSLVQSAMRDEPQQRQALLGLVKLLASILLSDLPRFLVGIVTEVLPLVLNEISNLLLVKKSVGGSVKDTLEKICIRVIDSTVLPTLVNSNSLVPAALIKTQMVMLAKNIHFAVMPESSKLEEEMKSARRNRGFLGMGVLIRGLVFTVAGQLESLLHDGVFQNKLVKIVHSSVRRLARVIQTAFRRYLISHVACQPVELVVDVTAEVLREKREDLTQVLTEIIELDVIGRVSVFIQSCVWRFLKVLVEGKEVSKLLHDIVWQVGFVGAAKDAAKAAWKWFLSG